MPAASSRGVYPTERFPVHLAEGNLDARLCERAIELLDKIRRCDLSPYAMEGRTLNLAQNVVTRAQTDDMKNIAGVPFIFREGRVFTAAVLAASASGAVFSDVSLQMVDNDRTQVLAKQDVLLPVLVSRETNTWKLDRPHVSSPAVSFSAVLREENAAATTDVYRSLLGTTVFPRDPTSEWKGVTAAEVREAVALGVFPTFSDELGTWERWTFFDVLFGEVPACASAAGEKLRWRLRERAAVLRLLLAGAQYHAHTLEASAADVTTNAETSLPLDRYRNDSGAALVLSEMALCTIAAPAASAVGAVFSNISPTIYHVGPNRLLTRSRVLAPVLCNRRDNIWRFAHPLVLAPDEALEVGIFEENVNGTTDVYAAFHGELIFGMSADEVREAVALGLYSTWDRG